jgi:hypothetical protein
MAPDRIGEVDHDQVGPLISPHPLERVAEPRDDAGLPLILPGSGNGHLLNVARECWPRQIRRAIEDDPIIAVGEEPHFQMEEAATNKPHLHFQPTRGEQVGEAVGGVVDKRILGDTCLPNQFLQSPLEDAARGGDAFLDGTAILFVQVGADQEPNGHG